MYEIWRHLQVKNLSKNEIVVFLVSSAVSIRYHFIDLTIKTSAEHESNIPRVSFGKCVNSVFEKSKKIST